VSAPGPNAFPKRAAPRSGTQSTDATIPPAQPETSRAPTEGQSGGWEVGAESITAGPPIGGSLGIDTAAMPSDPSVRRRRRT
jgi:hypothetical protein